MVRMFVESIDYRKQLTETVQKSIVYRKEKRVARFADTLQDFRLEASNKKLNELEKKLSEIEAEQTTLQELQKWAKS